jgi:hypothetical protein
MEITGTDTMALKAGGTTTAYIKVTAENGTTVQYYAVEISRAASSDDSGSSNKTLTVTETSSGLFKDGNGEITVEADVQNAFSNSVEVKITDTKGRRQLQLRDRGYGLSL